jgi:hypothetical protein
MLDMTNELELSKMELRELITITENEKHHYLEGLTFKHMNKDIKHALNQNIGRDIIDKNNIYHILTDKYRFVDEICYLHKGKHVRWIDYKGHLTTGGIVCNFSTANTQDSIIVTCLLRNKRFIKFNFNYTITFQLLHQDEIIILHLNTHYLTTDDDI